MRTEEAREHLGLPVSLTPNLGGVWSLVIVCGVTFSACTTALMSFHSFRVCSLRTRTWMRKKTQHRFAAPSRSLL